MNLGAKFILNRTTLLVCLVVCAVYALAAWTRPAVFGRFVPPPFDLRAETAAGGDAAPFFSGEVLPAARPSDTAHVASVCELSGGALMAVWYAGSKELARDVAVYGCVKGPGDGQWGRPQKLVDARSASAELKRAVRKVGNPLVWSDAGDRVYLLYVSAIGGWSSSSLNLKTSKDGGKTWSPSVRLTLSPFLNLSELVRNRPLPLSGGGFMVPIYNESIGKFPEMLWLLPNPGAPSGFDTVKSRIDGSRGFLQPSVVPLDSNSAVALLRNSVKPVVGRSASIDAGLTWSAPEFTGLPNPNAGICVVRIPGDRLLMVFNDNNIRQGERDNLRLAVSDLRGMNWTRIATLEDAPGQSFAYPYIVQTRDGLFHVVYSYNLHRIKHVSFNGAWIEERAFRHVDARPAGRTEDPN